MYLSCPRASPQSNFNESLSALRFADRAKHIVNKPTKYQDPRLQRIAEVLILSFEQASLFSAFL